MMYLKTSPGTEPVPFVEDLEGVTEGLVRVLGWLQGSPDTHEVEVIGDGHVHTILHLGGLCAVGDFGGGGVPSHGVHHSTDLVDVDFFGSGFVVHFEDFGELLDFLWVQLVVGHDDAIYGFLFLRKQPYSNRIPM